MLPWTVPKSLSSTAEIALSDGEAGPPEMFDLIVPSGIVAILTLLTTLGWIVTTPVEAFTCTSPDAVKPPSPPLLLNWIWPLVPPAN